MVRRVRPKAEAIANPHGSYQIRDGEQPLSPFVKTPRRAWIDAYGYLMEIGEINGED